MLNDLIKVEYITDSQWDATWGIIRTSGIAAQIGSNHEHRLMSIADGKSVRKGNGDGTLLTGDFKLTISHSETKENAPYNTSRALIRWDCTKSADSEGNEVTASVYLVTALPSGGVFTEADVIAMARGLMLRLLMGERPDDNPYSVSATGDDALERIVRGEP